MLMQQSAPVKGDLPAPEIQSEAAEEIEAATEAAAAEK